MKKLISTIIFVILSGCGFKVINISELNNFSIVNINSSGDKRINYIIKNNILFGNKKNQANQIIIDLNTKKNKNVKERNIKNEIVKYNITINANVAFKEIIREKDYNFTITKSGSFSTASQISTTRNNEKNLISILAKDLANEILEEIRLKLNDI
jgi:outer membrane lipopolysaccharide assembly protein LptE/RlpB